MQPLISGLAFMLLWRQRSRNARTEDRAGQQVIALRMARVRREEDAARQRRMYNDGEAVKWFRLAAKQGDAGAEFNLGVLYAEGRGVPRTLPSPKNGIV